MVTCRAVQTVTALTGTVVSIKSRNALYKEKLNIQTKTYVPKYDCVQFKVHLLLAIQNRLLKALQKCTILRGGLLKKIIYKNIISCNLKISILDIQNRLRDLLTYLKYMISKDKASV